MLHRNLPRQAHCIHSRCLRQNESKILSSQPISRATGLSRNRRWQTTPKLYRWTLHFQTKMPFYILTSNPQIIRGNMENWKITRFGHASKGKENTRINNEIRSSLSRKRITVSLVVYVHRKGSSLDSSLWMPISSETQLMIWKKKLLKKVWKNGWRAVNKVQLVVSKGMNVKTLFFSCGHFEAIILKSLILLWEELKNSIVYEFSPVLR